MTSQRDIVRASLLAQSTRETHSDVYSRRDPIVKPTELLSVATLTSSIRGLAEKAHAVDANRDLLASDRAAELERLALRLRNRLDALDGLLRAGCSR